MKGHGKIRHTLAVKMFGPVSKMPMFQRAVMRDGWLPLPLAFQYLILLIWRDCDLNLVMISLLTSKCQDIKLRGLQFQFIKQQKNGHFKFEDLPQALHDIRIKY